MSTFSFEPIGIISSPYDAPYTAPRQPLVDDRTDEAVIILNRHNNYEQALEDLAGFERIWIVAVFHNVETWKPKVLTPRDRTKRGVFATRSPHRPNPIAMSCVELLEINGLEVRIRGVDLLDGTPVLDIKPYLPYADSFENSAAGWTDKLSSKRYDVRFQDELDLPPSNIRDHIVRVLSVDPLPHPYRRISDLGAGRFQIAIQHWRCEFTMNDNEVIVDRVTLLP